MSIPIPTLAAVALSLCYSAVLICGWVERRIETRAATVAKQRFKFDEQRTRGKRYF